MCSFSSRSLLVLLALILAGCTNLFFLPDRVLYQTPEQLGLRFEGRDIALPNGEHLHAWFLPAEGTERAVVLFFHGNAQNISTHVNSVRWMPNRGLSVLLVDYRGYGASDGEADIEDVQVDVDTAIEFVQRMSDRVVVFGQSLGGALAIAGVARAPNRDRLCGIITESAFSSFRGIAREKIGETWLGFPVQYPLSFLVTDSYSPERFAGAVSPLPLLILHGRDDPIVPSHHASALYNAARQPKRLFVIPVPGHIGSAEFEPVRDAIVEFIDNSCPQPSRR